MKITNEIDWKILISDIETLACFIDLGFYNPDTDEWHEFEISEYKNDLFSFVNFYNSNDWDYIVYYNGISFDAQVIQYIINNANKWDGFNGIEIAQKVYEFVQDLIKNQSYSNFSKYKETEFTVPVIDVFTILGLNNLARMSSLKKIQFNLDMPQVEEMPIHHSVTQLSKVEIQEIINYRRNDVLSTYEIFKLCLGDTTHPIYKGNNQIELRIDIQNEFGIPCISYSDIKIGDELMKISYLKEKGITMKELGNKGYFRKIIHLKECIPSYIKFKTPFLQQLLKETKKVSVKQIDKYERNFKYGALNTEYTIGLGGGHSVNKHQKFFSDENITLCDLDVGSLYPALTINLNLFPKHLGKELLKVYTELYNKRMSLKPLSKTDKKVKGVCDAIKLSLNSAYGKMGSMDSWMFDKKVAYTICLAGQFSLLMLIEEMELNDIHCFYLNTDGITVKLPKEKKEIYDEICKEWQEKTNLVLEEVIYDKMILSNVNDYTALERGKDKPKKKGDFLTDFELWKNKSYRVVGMALEEYFINKKDPIEFIFNHNNIFDFCIMARATGNLHLEEVWEENDVLHTLVHKKLIRYYLSDTGHTLYKRGIGSTDKAMNNHINAPNELGNQYIQYFNTFEKKKIYRYDINYNLYVLKTLKIIDAIEKTKKADSFINSLKPQLQTSMF